MYWYVYLHAHLHLDLDLDLDLDNHNLFDREESLVSLQKGSIFYENRFIEDNLPRKEAGCCPACV